MKLLDLCCKAGGASTGYHQAGFEVTGVDKDLQPHYPFTFIQADALEYLAEHGHEYDVIAGSPPCQFFSELTPLEHRANHANLIPEMRRLMIATGKPYIIENVRGARRHLINPLMLCGSMFGLPIWRHRYFENNFDLVMSPASCNHNFVPVVVSCEIRRTLPVLISGRGNKRIEGKRYSGDLVAAKRKAMETPWMTEAEVTEAIPPAYTRWIGLQLIKYLQDAA